MRLKIVISLCLVLSLVLPTVLAQVFETTNAEQEEVIETAKRTTLTDWQMFKAKLAEAFVKLNEPRIKNKTDMCALKICSRPLKFKEQSKEKAASHNKASQFPGLNRKSKIVCFKDIKTGHKKCDIQI